MSDATPAPVGFMPGLAARFNCFLFGIAWPAFVFAIDPLFFPASGALFGGGDDEWPLMPLGERVSPEALVTYVLLALMIAGMLLHIVARRPWAGSVARPLLVLGIGFSAFFSVAIIPALPMALFIITAPFLLAPHICLLVYIKALRDSLREHPGSRFMRAMIVALLITGALAAPFGAYLDSVRTLERAERPSELASAIESIAVYGRWARGDLRRIYLDAPAPKKVRMRAMYIEIAGEPLFDVIADR